MNTLPAWIEDRDGTLLLRLRAQPGAKKDEIVLEETRLRVRLRAPAVEGKANRALLKFLAAMLGIRKNDLVLVRGEKSREKTIAVSRLSSAEVVKRLTGG